MKRIYLDNAATTPLDKRVAEAMHKFEKEYWGNPNSIHREGQNARAEIDFAREKISKFLSCKPQEIIFNSGATEANNHAIQGVVSFAINNYNFKPHVITTEIEHQSVYNLVKKLQKRGVIDATFIKPDKQGIIQAEDVIREITDTTVLISVIFVSNEIGAVLPIREIGSHLATVNLNHKSKILFHTDAVQAVKYFNCHTAKLGVDLLTLSGHKIGAPKGIGALYAKAGSKLDNLLTGGSQEYGMRAGTQNTAGIIGLAKAIELLGALEERQKNAQKISRLRDKIISEISKIENIEINGPAGEARSPDNISFSVHGIDSDTMITKLDLAGISASTGSACVSGSTEPSHVIKALGRITDWPSAIVRLSLSEANSLSDIMSATKIISAIAKIKTEARG